MFKFKFLLFFTCSLFSFNAISNSVLKLHETNVEVIRNNINSAEMLSSKLTDIKSATLDFHIQRGRWPVSKEELVSDGFYFGNFTTVYGTSINSVIDGNVVVYRVNVVDSKNAILISKIMSASVDDEFVEMRVGRPSQSSIISTTLSRVDNGDVTRNTMETNIYLSGHSIYDADEIKADAVYDSGHRVFSAANLPDKADVGLDNLENFPISNEYLTSRSNYYASEKAVGDSHAALLNAIESLTKSDIGLSNVPNYAATNSFTGNSSSLFATQMAVNASWQDLEDRIDNLDFSNADTLDGLDSSAFARSNITINGHSLTSNIELTKADIGLSNVPNYAATNNYSDDREDLIVTQKALHNAYSTLNSAKLNANATATNADKLDGIDSESFVQTSRRINGKNLGVDITLNATDVGLGNVRNYGISNSTSSDSQTTYASSRAVKSAKDIAKDDYSVQTRSLTGGAKLICDPKTGFSIISGYKDFGGTKNYTEVVIDLDLYFDNIYSKVVTPVMASSATATVWAANNTTVGRNFKAYRTDGGSSTSTKGLSWIVTGKTDPDYCH